MIIKLNNLLDVISEFLARRKGLLPALSILLIMCNYVIQFIPWFGWFSTSNFLLHFGIVLAIIGVLLAWAL